MLNQYNPQRFRRDARGNRVGVIQVGSIAYLQDGHSPLSGIRGRIVRRNPWIVVAWHNREYGESGKRMAGGHLASVKSLRDGREQLVADWILLQADDYGLVA